MEQLKQYNAMYVLDNGRQLVTAKRNTSLYRRFTHSALNKTSYQLSF